MIGAKMDGDVGMREKLIEAIIQTPCVAVSSSTAAEHIADNLIENGEAIPVRCKDCKYLHDELGCTRFGHDYSYPVVVVNDFCSYGERRTDAETMGK